MNDLIIDELRQVMNDWESGAPVTSIALGHSVREGKDDLGIRIDVPHVFRQKKTHAYVFELIDHALANPQASYDFGQFDIVAQETARKFQLSVEEQAAGESLAWVALRRGWKRAIAGFNDGHSISVKREAEA